MPLSADAARLDIVIILRHPARDTACGRPSTSRRLPSSPATADGSTCSPVRSFSNDSSFASDSLFILTASSFLSQTQKLCVSVNAVRRTAISFFMSATAPPTRPSFPCSAWRCPPASSLCRTVPASSFTCALRPTTNAPDKTMSIAPGIHANTHTGLLLKEPWQDTRHRVTQYEADGPAWRLFRRPGGAPPGRGAGALWWSRSSSRPSPARCRGSRQP